MAENTVFPEVQHNILQVLLKHSGDQLRGIMPALIGPKVTHDFWPGRIAGNGNKQVWFSIFGNNCHSTLLTLLHVAQRVTVGRWLDNWRTMPDISITIVSIKTLLYSFQVIHKASVLINAQLHLIVSNKLQTLFLNL